MTDFTEKHWEPPPDYLKAPPDNLTLEGLERWLNWKKINLVRKQKQKAIEEREERPFTPEDFEDRMRQRTPDKFSVEWPAMTRALLDERIDIRF